MHRSRHRNNIPPAPTLISLKFFLLFLILLPSITLGFVYEFPDQPLPRSRTYWILGVVSVTRDKDGSPTVDFDLKPSVSSEEDPGLKSVNIGLSPQWQFEHLEDAGRFCCSAEDVAAGRCKTKDTFNVVDDPGTYALSLAATSTIIFPAYALSLAATSTKKHISSSGTYYLWISNCGEKSLKDRTLSGQIKVRSSHGYVPPQHLAAQKWSQVMGFPFLLLGLAYLAYLFTCASSEEATSVKSLTAISLILNAVLLLAARPYANSAWNESGSRNSGRLFPNALGGVCLSVAYTIYFFLCAQKDVTSYNSILGGGEVKGGDSIMIAGTEKPRLTPGMWVGLIMINALIFVVDQMVIHYGSKALDDQGASFFKEALASDQANYSVEPTLFAKLGLDTTDLISLCGLVLFLYPVFAYAERREKLLQNDFSTRVLYPLRTWVSVLFAVDATIMLVLVFLLPKHVPLELESSFRLLSTLSFDLAVLVAHLMVMYFLASWDASIASTNKYAIVSERDLEMIGVDSGGNIEDEVDNYDPDQLVDTRE